MLRIKKFLDLLENNEFKKLRKELHSTHKILKSAIDIDLE